MDSFEPMNIVYDVVVGIGLTITVFSPVIFFVALNNLVTNERGGRMMDRNIFDEEVHVTGEWKGSFHAPVVVQRDMSIIANLRRMETITKGTNAHQTWHIKLSEYERMMRWKSTQDTFVGHPHDE